jgi:hypothetical protein
MVAAPGAWLLAAGFFVLACFCIWLVTAGCLLLLLASVGWHLFGGAFCWLVAAGR